MSVEHPFIDVGDYEFNDVLNRFSYLQKMNILHQILSWKVSLVRESVHYFMLGKLYEGDTVITKITVDFGNVVKSLDLNQFNQFVEKLEQTKDRIFDAFIIIRDGFYFLKINDDSFNFSVEESINMLEAVKIYLENADDKELQRIKGLSQAELLGWLWRELVSYRDGKSGGDCFRIEAQEPVDWSLR